MTQEELDEIQEAINELNSAKDDVAAAIAESQQAYEDLCEAIAVLQALHKECEGQLNGEEGLPEPVVHEIATTAGTVNVCHGRCLTTSHKFKTAEKHAKTALHKLISMMSKKQK